VNKAVGELVEWGYLEKRSQEESGESFCLYRTVIDQPDVTGGVSGKADTPVSAEADTGVPSRRTPVSPRKDTLVSHIDHVDKEKHELKHPAGTDGASGGRLPFSPGVIRELVSLNEDVETLIERYRHRTKGKRIADPSAYLLEMGRDAAAKRLGISKAALAKITSRNASEKAAALAGAVGAFSKPSEDLLRRVRRYRNPYVDLAVKRLSGRTFASQAAADRAFEAELVVFRFSSEAQRAL
jgi:hypothetical protein